MCPTYKYNYNRTLGEVNTEYFENENLPENGSCLDGQLKQIWYGNARGYPGKNRCVCLPNDGNRVFNDNVKVCASGDVQCPISPPFYFGENNKMRLKRIGRMFIKKGITEGCCPAGQTQSFLNQTLTGVDKTLCICHPPDDKLVFFEGLPKEDSSSLESH
jgi:hypothetical protein